MKSNCFNLKFCPITLPPFLWSYHHILSVILTQKVFELPIKFTVLFVRVVGLVGASATAFRGGRGPPLAPTMGNPFLQELGILSFFGGNTFWEIKIAPLYHTLQIFYHQNLWSIPLLVFVPINYKQNLSAVLVHGQYH